MTNALAPGESRVGFAWDSEITEPYAAMLRDREGRIELVIPRTHDDVAQSDRFERAFLKNKPAAEHMPEQCWFSDGHGQVCLVGVRSVAGQFVSSRPVAEAILRFRYAIFSGDSDIDYTAINGMNVDIEGLARWLGVDVVDLDDRRQNTGEVRLTIRPRQVIPVDTAFDLSFIAGTNWRSTLSPKVATIEEVANSSTYSKAPQPLAEHLDRHEAIRELLQISAWRPLVVRKLSVNHADDPHLVLSGDAVGERWAPVRTYDVPGPEESAYDLHFHFRFGDIGAEGVRRWLEIRRGFERGIGAMTFFIHHGKGSLDGMVSDAGIGLEEIGHRLFADGKRRWHHELLTKIGAEVTDLLPFDVSNWAAESTSVYNDVKHADRPEPDMDAMIESLCNDRIVFRTWLARRLGVSDEVVRKGEWLLKRSV